MPEKTEAQKKAQKKYMEKFMVAQVRMEREKYERVQAHAETQGESVNGFINAAIDEKMGRLHQQPVEAPNLNERAGEGILAPSTLKAAQEAAEAAGEGLPQFIDRAVTTQAKRDEVTRKIEGAE